MSYTPVTATITGSSIYANQQLLGLYELTGGDNIVLDSSGTIATTLDPSFTTLNVDGSLNVDGNFVNSSDTDATATIGRCKIGSPSTDTMFISHIDNMNSTDFCIKQELDGRTSINSKVGEIVNISIGGVPNISVDSNGYLSSHLTYGTDWREGLRFKQSSNDGGQNYHNWILHHKPSGDLTDNRLYFRDPSGNETIHIRCESLTETSDDRLKSNEILITNALGTINKMTPQIYNKHISFDNTTPYKKESGLMAQDIYYNTPELRHIVTLPFDENENDVTPDELPEGVNSTQELSSNIQDDPDYTSMGWGNNPASVNYTQLVPWLIAGMKEQQQIITSQGTQITTLESQVTDLLARVTALESA